MSAASLVLALLAGVLTILSPCVLPLVPVILAGAAAKHRLAPVALAAGVGLSFAAIGAMLASLGVAAGGFGGGELLRILAALALLVIGLVLIVPQLQTRFAMAAEPLSNWVNNRLGRIAGEGVAGQFGLGLLLGAIWTPCVGPTLGAASLLAAQGQQLGLVALTMLMFGLGAGAALAVIGLFSRALLIAWRGQMIGAGQIAKTVMGAGLLLVGFAILTGFDKPLEAILVDASPLWLTQLTTQF